MKESVYRYQARGSKMSIDLEILLDAGRALTENDERNIRECAEKLAAVINGESIRLNPDSQKQALEDKQGILEAFGSRNIYVEEIPNGYCSDYCCKHLPWFIVTTNKGRIKIGWRKRVIHLEWTDTIIKEDAETLFPSKDVTKYDKVIHAWGYEKAKEYLNKLLA